MAYSLGTRFAPPPKYFTILDPGAYQHNEKGAGKQNAAPFLSKTPRKTQPGGKLWTEAIYDPPILQKIQNCSSIRSKRPRFPYEAFSAEDLEEMLCKCGIITPCECPIGKETVEKEVVCQGTAKRRMFKGPTPRSMLSDEGLSIPSRKDHGFNILNDGSQHRKREEIKVECPPFYDTRVHESTAYYHGWKWSQRTSIRSMKSLEVKPGPADYFLEREANKEEICAEKFRALKRKTSKQLRFIEMVQQRNILEGRPGPATYDPMLPRGTDLKYIGSKAKRFPPASKYDVRPGPADHWVRRDLDPVPYLDVHCHATLPERACFGNKAKRFKLLREVGPSPATYDTSFRQCHFVHCGTAPFGASAERFKQQTIEESDDEEILENEPYDKDENETQSKEPCPKPTWEFKSKTIRMKPLIKKNDEPSPADLAQTGIKIERSFESQFIAPFFSSEGRFQPWYTWIPVHGRLKTPGPATYCLEKPKCPPAFIRGPLSREERFPKRRYQTPAPNEYKVSGIETILATHNKRLKNNIKNQYNYHWEPPQPKKILSFEEQEQLIIQKCISLLDFEGDEGTVAKLKEVKIVKEVPETEKPKMLRTFLYARPLPMYI